MGSPEEFYAFYVKELKAKADQISDKDEFKQFIIPEIIKYFNVDLSYNPYQGMLDKTIEISNLFDGFNDCTTKDYIEGKVGNTFIQFSYCRLICEGNRNDNELLFEGIYFLATFNRKFYGQYMVFPDWKIIKPYIDVPGKGLVEPETIKLENPEFCKQFTVLGTDQVEARYLLTPGMMQAMVDFKNRMNDKVYFAFARNHFFVCFPLQGGLSEDAASLSPRDNAVMTLCRNIYTSISIVDSFNINNLLWSKPS